MNIQEIKFEDLYLGKSFADVTGRDGQGGGRSQVPAAWEQLVEQIRQECMWRFQKNEADEFALNVNNVLLRVTVFTDLNDELIFVLRRSNAKIFPVSDLGLPDDVMEMLLGPNLRGLVLFGGRMRMGKTSAVASLIRARGDIYNDIIFAFEEPVETLLNGEMGKGRCIQVPVSQATGGYPNAMKKAVRSGAASMFIGEIRNSETAGEVLQAAMTSLVFSTSHGETLENMLERFHSFASNKFESASEMMANALSVVIYQEKHVTQHEGRNIHRFTTVPLIVAEQIEVQSKIRASKFNQLGDLIQQQQSSRTYG